MVLRSFYTCRRGIFEQGTRRVDHTVGIEYLELAFIRVVTSCWVIVKENSVRTRWDLGENLKTEKSPGPKAETPWDTVSLDQKLSPNVRFFASSPR